MSVLQNHHRPWCRMGLFEIAVEVIAVAALSAGLLLCDTALADGVASQAFELRIGGQTEAAKDLLTKHLASHPDDDMAHYELARTYYYMGPGDPKEMNSTIQKAEEMMTNALKLKPDNPNYRYFAARVTFFKSYMAMAKNEDYASEPVAAMCKAYERVLQINPNHGPTLMNLVELYGGMPADMGGVSAKAAKFAAKLEGIDPVLAGKAHCVMMPEDFDRIAYWKAMLDKHPGDAAVLDELCKTCLREGHTEDGVEYLKQAMKADPSNTVLYLVLANHHIMKVWQDETAKETAIPAAAEALNQFLATEPIAPLKAYAMGIMAKLSYGQDNQADGDKWVSQAKATDAYFSKASGIPLADLFVPPGDELSHHRYLFQPF